MDKLHGSVEALASHATGRDQLSKSDLRNMAGTLALQNAFGIYNGLNALVDSTSLPKTSR